MKKIILFMFLLISLFSLANAKIFVLHRFDDSRYPSTSIDTKELRRYFDILKENNYEVVPLESIIKRIQAKEDIPNNWVAFTIDDAYKSFYEHGLEVFKEYAHPFTLFVFAEATDRNYPDFMTWEELRESEKFGTVGNHSYGHPHLTYLSLEEIKEDTLKAKELLDKNLSKPLNYYTYPYGEYNEEVRNTIKNLGFEAIFNQSTGAVSKNSNTFNIDRIALGNNENILSKLKIGHLEATWEKVEVNNNHVGKIRVILPPDIKKVELFLSTYSWKYASVIDGVLEYNIDKPLKLGRSRIIIKDFNNRWTSFLIMKEK